MPQNKARLNRTRGGAVGGGLGLWEEKAEERTLYFKNENKTLAPIVSEIFKNHTDIRGCKTAPAPAVGNAAKCLWLWLKAT